MKPTALTIIIPVREEARSIGKTIKLLEKFVHTLHTIIVADDTIAPTDKTLDVVRQLEYRNIVISKKRNGQMDGFGPALCRAISLVKTPYVIFVMADLSDDPKTIDSMVDIAKEKIADIVVGSRYIRGGKKIGGPIFQGALSTALNWYLHTMKRIPTTDSTNAFKLYTKTMLMKSVPKKPELGISFSLQLFLTSLLFHPVVVDVPTIWKGRSEGKSKAKLFQQGRKYLNIVSSYTKRNKA